VIPVLELAVTTAAIAFSAGVVAASLKLRGTAAYVLASYVIAYAEIVVITAALSLTHLVSRWAIIVGVATLLAVSVGAWIVVERPRGPSPAQIVRNLLSLMRDRPLAVLAGGAALAFIYITALALFTPPNSVDALWYHLARAGFWKQQHAVGYISNANDARLNGSPPVSEISVLYTMVVSGTDRFVTMVALAGYVAMIVCVFGIARRLAVERREALFAALAFATLPIVALQASGALNDLVIGSFLAICVYFSLGDGNVEAVLAGLSLALAFGTKAYAPLALPIIALIVALGTKRSRAIKLTAIGVVAVATGSIWNIVNLAKTGSYEGGIANADADYSLHGFAGLIALPMRYLIDFAEVPGAGGWWLTAYVASALPIAAWFLFKGRALGRGPLIGSVLVGLVPFLVVASAPVVTHGYRVVFFHLGRPDLGVLGYHERIVTASPMTSYYGPLGLLLLLSPIAILIARRNPRGLTLTLAAAPLLFVVLLTLTLGYGVFNGRFFAFAMALAAASFSLFLRSRLIRWTVAAVALPTVMLTLRANIEKPPSIWGEPRWQVQTRGGRGSADVIRFADNSIPAGAHIGLAVSDTDWSYPFFGSDLQHVISFVPSTSTVPADVGWLVATSGQSKPPREWRAVVGAPGLYKR
jgi:hypothetical protein